MADELIRRNADLNRTSAGGGVLAIAVGTSAAFISSQQCRSCLIKAGSLATTYIELDGTDATATCARLDETYVPLPVANLSVISLYATAANTVFIIWRD